MSVDLRGRLVDGEEPSISADGRFVAFNSASRLLVRGATNGLFDTYVRDLRTHHTVRVSVSSTGRRGNGSSYYPFTPQVVAGGTLVYFTTEATNLTPRRHRGSPQLLVHNMITGTTRFVLAGFNPDVAHPVVSPDGRFLAISQPAPGCQDLFSCPTRVYVRNLRTGQPYLVSVNNQGRSIPGRCEDPLISAHGRFVTFIVVSGSTTQLYLRNRTVHRTRLISRGVGGRPGNGFSQPGSVTPDGRFVVFYSSAENLVRHDTNHAWDAFIRQRF